MYIYIYIYLFKVSAEGSHHSSSLKAVFAMICGQLKHAQAQARDSMLSICASMICRFWQPAGFSCACLESNLGDWFTVASETLVPMPRLTFGCDCSNPESWSKQCQVTPNDQYCWNKWNIKSTIHTSIKYRFLWTSKLVLRMGASSVFRRWIVI